MLKYLITLISNAHNALTTPRTYYIAFKKYPFDDTTSIESWVIRRTKNDMDSEEGLQQEIKEMEAQYGCDIWILNWKPLN